MRLPEVIAGARISHGPARLDLRDALLRTSTADGAVAITADRDRAVIQVAGVGRFVARGGASVEACVEDAAAAGAWLHGTVTAFVLAQRGEFALHASVVEVAGRGVALAGPQRVGKSTTALRLALDGARLVSDDLAPLEVIGGRVLHRPTGRPIHLWPDAARRLGIDLTGAGLVAPGFDKVALPAPEGGAVELRAVIALRAGQAILPGEDDVSGPGAAAVLFANAYRVELLRVIWGVELLSWAARVAERITVTAVTRPPGDWTVDAVARAVEHLVARL